MPTYGTVYSLLHAQLTTMLDHLSENATAPGVLLYTSLLLKMALYYEDGSVMDTIIAPLIGSLLSLKVISTISSLSDEETVQLVILYVSLVVGVLRIAKVHNYII